MHPARGTNVMDPAGDELHYYNKKKKKKKKQRTGAKPPSPVLARMADYTSATG